MTTIYKRKANWNQTHTKEKFLRHDTIEVHVDVVPGRGGRTVQLIEGERR